MILYHTRPISSRASFAFYIFFPRQRAAERIFRGTLNEFTLRVGQAGIARPDPAAFSVHAHAMPAAALSQYSQPRSARNHCDGIIARARPAADIDARAGDLKRPHGLRRFILPRFVVVLARGRQQRRVRLRAVNAVDRQRIVLLERLERRLALSAEIAVRAVFGQRSSISCMSLTSSPRLPRRNTRLPSTLSCGGLCAP